MINPVSESVVEVNRQTQLIEYDQICISKDNVQFQTNVIIFFRFVDTLKAAYKLGQDGRECVMEIANGTLRTIAGEHILQ